MAGAPRVGWGGEAGWSTSSGGKDIVRLGPCPLRVPAFFPRPFRPRPPQQPTTEGGDGETKPSQGPTDGSRPEPQRPRNRPYFQRRRQQPPGPRQSAAPEVGTWDRPAGVCQGETEAASLSPFFPCFCLLFPALLFPPSVSPSSPGPAPPPLSHSLTPKGWHCGVSPWRAPHPPRNPSRSSQTLSPLQQLVDVNWGREGKRRGRRLKQGGLRRPRGGGLSHPHLFSLDLSPHQQWGPLNHHTGVIPT